MATNYRSHSIKLYADNDLHYLNLRDGKDTVSGFGAEQRVILMLLGAPRANLL